MKVLYHVLLFVAYQSSPYQNTVITKSTSHNLSTTVMVILFRGLKQNFQETLERISQNFGQNMSILNAKQIKK